MRDSCSIIKVAHPHLSAGGRSADSAWDRGTQAVQAAQITFEDYFMADLDIAPLKIVGWEGVFGTLIMLCVLLPAVYFVPGTEGNGFHENSLETLHVRALGAALPCLMWRAQTAPMLKAIRMLGSLSFASSHVTPPVLLSMVGLLSQQPQPAFRPSGVALGQLNCHCLEAVVHIVLSQALQHSGQQLTSRELRMNMDKPVPG